MASNQKVIYVYESFRSTTPNFLGTLFVENVRGRESYSFEYDADWLKSSANYMYLDPDLQLYAGRQYPTGAKNVFGLFADSSPDRWGRLLMTRRERILAEQEGRKPRKLLDSDFLMGVYDETRMGAIRFKLDKDGPFLSDDSKTPTPPWTSLRTLEEASRQFENDESGLEQKWINQLIKPGSSLGGARPKATVLDTKGNLWIAKFPSKHDDVNVGAWEKVTHDLARLCGLDVPESMLIDFSKYRAILDSINRVSVKDIDLQRFLVFTIGQTELILPTGWEYRCTRSLGLASVFCNTLINLGGVQVEYNQILIISMDDLANQLVPVINIPVHQLKELCKEELTRHLTGPPLPTRCVAPRECVSL